MPEKFPSTIQSEESKPPKRRVGPFARALVVLGTIFAPGVIHGQDAPKKTEVETRGEVSEKSPEVNEYGVMATSKTRNYLREYKKVEVNGIEVLASDNDEQDRKVAKSLLTSDLFRKKTVHQTIDEWFGVKKDADQLENIRSLSGIKNLERNIGDLTDDEIEELLDAIKEEIRPAIEEANAQLARTAKKRKVDDRKTSGAKPEARESSEKLPTMNRYGIYFISSIRRYLDGWKVLDIDNIGAVLESHGEKEDRAIARKILKGVYWTQSVHKTITLWIMGGGYNLNSIQESIGLRSMEIHISQLTAPQIEKLLDEMAIRSEAAIKKANSKLATTTRTAKEGTEAPGTNRESSEKMPRINVYGVPFDTGNAWDGLFFRGHGYEPVKIEGVGSFAPSRGEPADRKVAKEYLKDLVRTSGALITVNHAFRIMTMQITGAKEESRVLSITPPDGRVTEIHLSELTDTQIESLLDEIKATVRVGVEKVNQSREGEKAEAKNQLASRGANLESPSPPLETSKRIEKEVAFEKEPKINVYGLRFVRGYGKYFPGMDYVAPLEGEEGFFLSRGDTDDQQVAEDFLESAFFYGKMVRDIATYWTKAGVISPDKLKRRTRLDLDQKISTLSIEERKVLLDGIRAEVEDFVKATNEQLRTKGNVQMRAEGLDAREIIEQLHKSRSLVGIPPPPTETPEPKPQPAKAPPRPAVVPPEVKEEIRHKFNMYGIKYNPKSELLMRLGCKDSGIKARDGGTFCATLGVSGDTRMARALLTSPSYIDKTWEEALKQWSNGGYGAEWIGGINPNKRVRDASPSEITKVLARMRRVEDVAVTSKSVKPTESPVALAKKNMTPAKVREKSKSIVSAGLRSNKPVAQAERTGTPYTAMGGVPFPLAAEGTNESNAGARYAKKEWQKLEASYTTVEQAIQEYRTAKQKMEKAIQSKNTKEVISEALRGLRLARKLLIEARDNFYSQEDRNNTDSARGAIKDFYLAAQREVNTRSAASQEYFKTWRKVGGWYTGLIRVVYDQADSALRGDEELFTAANRKLTELRANRRVLNEGSKGVSKEAEPGGWRKDWQPYPPEGGATGTTPKVPE